nr:MAG TPA: hypothetical protein [Caudoviricetes sp.]
MPGAFFKNIFANLNLFCVFLLQKRFFYAIIKSR